MTLTNGNWAEIAQTLEAQADEALLARARPRFNVAPSDIHPILLHGAGRTRIPAFPDASTRRLVGARWGFARPGAQPGGLVINARCETLLERPMFRDGLAERRCLVVTDGFLEWRRESKAVRQPMWFHRPDHGLMLLAGIFQDDGARFVVLTTKANAVVGPVHDRMPVVMAMKDIPRWLSRPDGELLEPLATDELQMTPVNPRVNNVGHDDPACLAPPDATIQSATMPQLSLFR